MSVELGQIIPDFSCIADDEVVRSLESQRGNWLVLFFYPKASTLGCTTESRDFSAFKAEFESLD